MRIGLAVTLALVVGCGDKETAGAPRESVGIGVASGSAPSSDAAGSSGQGGGSVAPTSVVVERRELPVECAEYRVLVEKIATCDKIPQEQRDHMKKAYAATSATWPNVPPDGKSALATACRAAAADTRKAGSKCGWR